MKAPNHNIVIDAQAAFTKLGVDLSISPIADHCVTALQKHLIRCITQELLIAALTDAGRASKSRRGPKKSGAVGEKNQTGGNDES